jgi:hypothetical protein
MDSDIIDDNENNNHKNSVIRQPQNCSEINLPMALKQNCHLLALTVCNVFIFPPQALPCSGPMGLISAETTEFQHPKLKISVNYIIYPTNFMQKV